MRGNATSPSRRGRVALVALGLASSALFLWLVVRRVDLGEVWLALRQADLAELLAAAAVIELVYVAQGIRWRGLSGVANVRRRHFVALVVAGVGTNNVLPLRVGDILRGRWLANAAAVPTGTALASVVRDRISDVVVLSTGMLVTVPLVGSAAWTRRIAVGGIVLLGLFALAVATAYAYARRRPRARRAHRGRLRGLLRDLLDELASPLGRRRIAVALALSVVAWSAWALSARLVCLALGIRVSAVAVVFVTCVINLGVALPSSPGFVGTYQWLAVSSLAVVGVGSDVALAFAVLMQAIWFVPTTLVGGPLALREAGRDRIVREAVT